MENNFDKGKTPDLDDVAFRPDLNDESRQSSSGTTTSGAVNPQKISKGPLLAILLIAAIAIITMFVALIYDWGVNRNGFNDIAELFTSDKKEVVKEKEITVEKDLPEYEEYMQSMEEEKFSDDEFVYEEETIINQDAEKDSKSDVLEKPLTKSPGVQKTKEQKPAPQKQTKDLKVDLEKVPYPDNVRNRIQKSSVKEADQLFTIQVYSTPSKDDAEAWKEKLLKQNINDVTISSHRIKNRNWYRVRFGTFKSIDEAKKAASLAGFAHSWIDRVK